MDLNFQFWRSEGETFLQRFCHWLDILDPLLLFPSYVEIDKSRMLLETSRENITESLQDNKLKKAWKLSLASVHPGTGDIIPPMFRPPGFCYFLIAQRSETSIYLAVPFPFLYGCIQLGKWKFYKNGKRVSVQTVTSHHRDSLIFFMCWTLLCMMNVMVIRSTELVSGIEVVDSNGNVIGLSRKAGEKAVKETAWLRAALFGTAVFIPDIAEHYLKRTRILLRNPHALPLLRLIMTTVIIGTMIPVSFSWEPQVGKIQRSELESEIVSSTEETELFYYRGI
ncbi:sideroflexin-4 isoform X4 [Hemicordylus capensis]|uniref:sideroflexin-4 isoform X4 n=1 Tax=Hemicordylus capensis TaxID=884348 RepID=UPI0023041265|nr:sideroflexin-4 isoform X4 [Hemicordylus capensis]